MTPTRQPRVHGAADRGLSQRRLAEQALSRAAGAPLVAGNRLRLLRDARENFPAWLDAIRGARHHIFFESYIFQDDVVGREFAEALRERAAAGVKVFVLYDWLGTWGSRGLWPPLRAAGAQVRCFNPPKFDSPFGWLSRDHRKSIVVDGTIGFVGGLCVSARWIGDEARGIEPWRDTGVEIRGPAVADLEEAFARVWAETGPPLHEDDVDLSIGPQVPAVGEVPLRVVATMPNLAGLFRLDQLIASLARRRLWLTDAYFVGITPYVQALCAAARDGVDVRLLVPGASDIPVLSPLSRAGYRPLLEAGVRVFEWNGPMLHAKTAVADERWARVGSTNLNIASFMANYELDVAVEDEAFASTVADMYEEDLQHATEIVLAASNRVRPTARRRRRRSKWRPRSGSAGRAAAGALSLGSAVSAAMTNHRVLGAAEARMLFIAGLTLLGIAAVGVVWPFVLTVPFAVLGAWMGSTLLLRALRLLRHREPAGAPAVPESQVAPRARRRSHELVVDVDAAKLPTGPVEGAVEGPVQGPGKGQVDPALP
ncbi:MAG TPA: phospholipase D-like domain-containing protein [Polyangia bacterium]